MGWDVVSELCEFIEREREEDVNLRTGCEVGEENHANIRHFVRYLAELIHISMDSRESIIAYKNYMLQTCYCCCLMVVLLEKKHSTLQLWSKFGLIFRFC